MTRLKWGEGPPMYDQGVDHGVLYLGDTAVPWTGIVSIEERDTGTIDVEHYFDGQRLNVSQEIGDFEASISAYTHPEAFSEFNGYSEREIYRRFALSYRTRNESGYKLHLIYNILVQDGDRSWSTQSNKVDPSLFRWDISASAVRIPGASPAAHLAVTSKEESTVFNYLEDILYGSFTTDARMPDPEELVELYEDTTLLRITYNGDGTYTATGPDTMVRDLGDGRFEINAPTAQLLNQDVFRVQSY